MRSIGLILGTYNHQPEGQPAELVEQAYQRAYKPFLSLLYECPRIPAVLHYSGCLLEWLERSHPEFLMLLKELIQRKQVELLGGGYHAPVLSILPDADKLGQIEKLTTYLRTTFRARPRGGWIAERVWEPGLVRILRNSNLDYTFLDDRHLQAAGVPEGGCYFPYLTEDQGKTVTVLPLHLGLAERVPGQSPEELVLVLNQLAGPAGNRMAGLMLPGEKLGLARGSHERCYKGGWLRSLLKLLEENREWLHVFTPRGEPELLRPRGKIYLPCLSSAETTRCALSSERQRTLQDLNKKLRKQESEQYLQGGYFRQFLTRYPEVNLLYSRLLYTHILIAQVRGDRYKKRAAMNELWRGEGGEVYWHGPPDGVRSAGAYAPQLRHVAYRSFIEAERICRSATTFMPSIIETDFDTDGDPEYLYQGKVLNALVHRRGGSLLELDYLPKAWNYLDTMARWAEPYHRYRYEGCDRYLRRAFLDHFFASGTTLAQFERMSHQELGNFIDQPFGLEELKRDQRELTLSREGRIRLGRKEHALRIDKRYRFRENAIELGLRLTSGSAAPLHLQYGVEVNLALRGKEAEAGRLLLCSAQEERELEHESAEAEQGESLRIQDLANDVLLTLSADKAFTLWCLPVETVVYSPAGREKAYQGTCFLPRWSLTLEPSQSWELGLSLELRKG
jgi:hypothetical protein